MNEFIQVEVVFVLEVLALGGVEDDKGRELVLLDGESSDD